MNVSASLSVSDFIARWEASGAAERANYQLFLSELCDVLGVERPAPQEADGPNAIACTPRFHVEGGRVVCYVNGPPPCGARAGPRYGPCGMPCCGACHAVATLILN